jgi:hypothetical protein
MGSSISLDPYTVLEVNPVTLPIPNEIGDPIIRWYRKEPMNDEHNYVEKFKTFINSPARVKGIIMDSARKPTEYFDSVLGLFYRTPRFSTFLVSGEVPDQTGVVGVRDEVVTGVKRFNLDALRNAVDKRQRYSVIFAISITSSTHRGGHSNTGLIRCDNGMLSLYLFEPHYPIRKNVIDVRVGRIRNFISRIVPNAEWVDVRSIGGSIAPLQTTSDNCAQWSLLMCLFFVLNGHTRVTEGFNLLTQYRSVVMPLWLFFLYTTWGKEAEYTETDPRGEHRRYYSTDLDMYQCHVRTQEECVHPCKVHSDGTCINAALFRDNNKST